MATFRFHRTQVSERVSERLSVCLQCLSAGWLDGRSVECLNGSAAAEAAAAGGLEW